VPDALLVLNAGSSSLKFSVFAEAPGSDPEMRLRGQIEGIGTAPHFIARDAARATLAEQRWPSGAPFDHAAAVEHLLGWLDGALSGAALVACGHRVVHGGLDFAEPVRVDRAILDRLAALIPLAPLHQPHNLAPIRTLMRVAPGLPQVACFDTAFHRTQPALAQTFALPRALSDEGIRRYGFHGLSYEYVAQALPALGAELGAARVVVAHLGNGASMCAISGGRSVATTMGFTALDGLPMGTRTGAIDPGVLLHLMRAKGLDAAGLEKLLYHQSGLLGVSGVSSDMRALRASADPHAAEAIELFTYRIGRELGSLAAALGGLDALVFTAGIGENDPVLRADVCRAGAWLGIELDEQANAAGGPRISTAGSRISAWVVPTNEELMIARRTRAAVGRA
jgi:acetate kinase